MPFFYFVYPFLFPFPDNFSENEWKKFGHRLINWSIFISISIAFPYLYYLTNKYHKFEFETGQKQMVCFFINTVIFVMIQVVTVEIVFSGDMMGPTVCFPHLDGFRKYQGYIDFFGNYLGVMEIWICWVIVVLKINKDGL